MLKKIFPLLLLPVLFFGSCKAQKSADNKSLLWRISGKDGTQPSYLFGTIHLLCKDDYVWTDAMKDALKNSKEVCFEMDMDDPQIINSASDGLSASNGKALKDYFTPAQYERLAAFSKKEFNMDLNEMQQMKPVMLQALFVTKTVDCPMPISYELNIMMEAKKEGKEIVGLEQPQEQLDVLNGQKEDSVIADLVQLPDSFQNARREYAAMLSAYKKQDLPGLYKMASEPDNSATDNNDAFLNNRNVKWIPRMKEKMKGQSVFFAVGAGHLWGKQGVITLLRKAGYQVEPVH